MTSVKPVVPAGCSIERGFFGGAPRLSHGPCISDGDESMANITLELDVADADAFADAFNRFCKTEAGRSTVLQRNSLAASTPRRPASRPSPTATQAQAVARQSAELKASRAAQVRNAIKLVGLKARIDRLDNDQTRRQRQADLERLATSGIDLDIAEEMADAATLNAAGWAAKLKTIGKYATVSAGAVERNSLRSSALTTKAPAGWGAGGWLMSAEDARDSEAIVSFASRNGIMNLREACRRYRSGK